MWFCLSILSCFRVYSRSQEFTEKTATRLEARFQAFSQSHQPLLPNLTHSELLDNSTTCDLNKVEKASMCWHSLNVFPFKTTDSLKQEPLARRWWNYFSSGVCMPQNTSQGRAPREVHSTALWRSAQAFSLPFPSSSQWSA